MALYTPVAKEEYDDEHELLQSPEASDGYVREGMHSVVIAEKFT